MKESLPILLIVGAAGIWLAFVFAVLRFFGIHLS